MYIIYVYMYILIHKVIHLFIYINNYTMAGTKNPQIQDNFYQAFILYL